MQLININNNILPCEVYKPTFQGNSSLKKPKSIEFFDILYSGPNNINLNWKESDELKGDSLLNSNFGIIKHNFPFIDFLEDTLFRSKAQNSVVKNYESSDFVTGYKNKRITSEFYTKKTKPIQEKLKNIPVYTILNGRGEIILANSFSKLIRKEKKAFLIENLYNYCGAFDSQTIENYSSGLFFLDRYSAELYLKEVVNSDLDGAKALGLSLHCISLDSAYRVTRESHPNIDFRFVPKFNELSTLFEGSVTNDKLIFDEDQQQLRFRRRPLKLMSSTGNLGNWATPFNSFLQHSEYYKGVPVYIVQLKDIPRNLIFESYFNLIGTIEHSWSGFLQSLDRMFGCGHNWVMQGSLYKVGNSENVTNYVFFEAQKAVQFCNKYTRRIGRYNGSRTSAMGFFIRKPKIFVHNLEDFLEKWEDVVLNKNSSREILKYDDYLNVNENNYTDPSIQYCVPTSLFSAKNTVIIPATSSLKEIQLNKIKKQSGSFSAQKVKNIKQSLKFKSRTLVSYMNILLNYN
jgi:hypothetical protein